MTTPLKRGERLNTTFSLVGAFSQNQSVVRRGINLQSRKNIVFTYPPHCKLVFLQILYYRLVGNGYDYKIYSLTPKKTITRNVGDPPWFCSKGTYRLLFVIFHIYRAVYILNKNDIFTECYFYTVKIFTAVK